MKINKLFFILGLLFCFEALTAQSYMVLRKKGTARRYEYRAGDNFIYRQKGSDVFYDDRITEFADSTVVLENNIIRIDQIAEVNVSNAFSNRPEIFRSAERVLPIAGYGLFAIDLFNNSIVEGNPFTLEEGTTITSGALILTGYSLKWMRRKKINLTNPKFEVYIVNF